MVSIFLPLFFILTQQRAFEGNRVTRERMWLTFIGFPFTMLDPSPDQREPVWLSLGGGRGVGGGGRLSLRSMFVLESI